jgi:hypothetical protein
MKSIPTFTCPSITPTKRARIEKSSEHKSKSTTNYSHDTEDIKDIYESIKQFNANELKGKERIKLKVDKLTELGAPPIKQQKVPFKIQMARLSARAKRQKDSDELLKESGLVTSKLKKVTQKKNQSNKFRGKDSIQPSIGVKTHQGIYYVNKR